MAADEPISGDDLQNDDDQNESRLLESRTDRSHFLRGAAVAGLIGGIELLYPGAGGAASRFARRPAVSAAGPRSGTFQVTAPAAGPDIGFARGEVTAVTAAGVLVENALRSRAVIWPPNMTVWKEFFIPASEVTIGDTLSVRGTPQSDGSLLARPQWAWVNIGIRQGQVMRLNPTQVVIRGTPGATHTLDLSSTLDVVDVNTGAPVPDLLARVSPGTQVGAVGLASDDGSFRATRIWFDAA
jgi:hypothetical protein